MGRSRALISTPGLAILLALALAGCASRSYDTPPTAWGGLTHANATAGGARILFGDLANPSSASIRDRRIGPTVTDAFSRRARQRSGAQVVSDSRLARRIASAVEYSGRERERLLEEFARDGAPADYAVLGGITDFHHTRDLHEQVRQTEFGSRNEAVVAINYQVVDLRTLRVVAEDHVRGVARAPDVATRDLYRNIPVGSVVFWESPLGRASTEAIDRAATRLRQVLAVTDGSIRIVRRDGKRRYVVTGGRSAGLREGQVLYVLSRADAETTTPVIDPVLRTPLRARVTGVTDRSAEVWLLGEPPADVPLSRASLAMFLPDGWNDETPAEVTEAEKEAVASADEE